MKHQICLLFLMILLISCEKVSVVNNPSIIPDANISTINTAMNLQISNIQSNEISNVVPNKVWQAVSTKKKYLILTSINQRGEILQSDFIFDKNLQLPDNIYNYIQLHYGSDGTPQSVEEVLDPLSKKNIGYKLQMYSNNHFFYLLFDEKGTYTGVEPYDVILPNPNWAYGDYANFPDFVAKALTKANLYLDYVNKYHYFFLVFEDSKTKKPYYLIKVANRLPDSNVTYLRVDSQGNIFYQANYFSFEKGFQASTKSQMPMAAINFLNQKFNSWTYDHSILKYGEMKDIKILPIEYFINVNLDAKRTCSIRCTNVGEVISYNIATPIGLSELPTAIVNDLSSKYSGWEFSKAESRELHGSYYTPNFYVEVKRNNETYECFYRHTPNDQVPYTLMYSYKK
jgi:hypothetical protein